MERLVVVQLNVTDWKSQFSLRLSACSSYAAIDLIKSAVVIIELVYNISFTVRRISSAPVICCRIVSYDFYCAFLYFLFIVNHKDSHQAP